MHATICLVEHLLMSRMQYCGNALLLRACTDSLYRVRMDSIITPKLAVPDYFCEAVISSDEQLLKEAHRYVYNANKGHVITLVKRHIKLVGVPQLAHNLKLPSTKSPVFETGLSMWGLYPLTEMVKDIEPHPTQMQINFLYQHNLIG